MSDVLALKYRPSDWKQVIGQQTVVRSLKSVLSSGRNRTFLLSGASGLGKTTLARVAAISLGITLRASDEINAAKLTGVDDMRQVLDTLNYKPIGGGKRVIILDECHMLSKSAWNSLLKSLEEPPEWLYWFLCTTDPDKVPATVQTRCSKYQLKPVSREELREHLQWITEEEKLNLGEDEDSHDAIIDLCVKQAHGGVRAAINNLGACIGAKTKDAAKTLLSAAAGLDESKGIDLARALMKNPEWSQIKEILQGLRDQNPEGVRHVVQAYMTNVVLGNKSGDVEPYLAVLDAFSKPFSTADGMAPLVLACGSLIFGGEE